MAAENKPYVIVEQVAIRIEDEQVRNLVREYVTSLGLPGVPRDKTSIEVQATSDGGLTAVARYRKEG